MVSTILLVVITSKAYDVHIESWKNLLSAERERKKCPLLLIYFGFHGALHLLGTLIDNEPQGLDSWMLWLNEAVVTIYFVMLLETDSYFTWRIFIPYTWTVVEQQTSLILFKMIYRGFRDFFCRIYCPHTNLKDISDY